MNNIILNICIVAVITAIFRILSPENIHKNQFKLIVSCFFIITVINIFSQDIELSGIGDIIRTETTYNDYKNILNEQVADETANELRKKLKYVLSEENIEPEKIYIDINISENSCISISKIRLVFTNKNSVEAERAVELTEKYLGYEIAVELEEI